MDSRESAQHKNPNEQTIVFGLQYLPLKSEPADKTERKLSFHYPGYYLTKRRIIRRIRRLRRNQPLD